MWMGLTCSEVVVRRICYILRMLYTAQCFFFLNDTAPPEISPFPLHAVLPISRRAEGVAFLQGKDGFFGRGGGGQPAQPAGGFHRRVPADDEVAVEGKRAAGEGGGSADND